MIIRYERPRDWIAYDPKTILQPLTGAKAAILALTRMQYQRSWADELQLAEARVLCRGAAESGSKKTDVVDVQADVR